MLTNTAASAVLYDPTVEKKASLAALNGLPAGVLSDAYEGLYYFPNLPPNLINRVWFDPNGTNLVLEGEFVDDPVNGNYVMLNVLRGDDLAAVDGLCSPAPPPAIKPGPTPWPSWRRMCTPSTKYPAVPGSYVQ